MKKTETVDLTNKQVKEIRKAINTVNREAKTLTIKDLGLSATKDFAKDFGKSAVVKLAKQIQTLQEKRAKADKKDRPAITEEIKKVSKDLTKAKNHYEFGQVAQEAMEKFVLMAKSDPQAQIIPALELLKAVGLHWDSDKQAGKACYLLIKMVPFKAASNLQALKGNIAKASINEFKRSFMNLLLGMYVKEA